MSKDYSLMMLQAMVRDESEDIRHRYSPKRVMIMEWILRTENGRSQLIVRYKLIADPATILESPIDL